jgi:hypothetical protein
MVHGTGTGKTCTGIQIAEEYILRPEYQDKKVLVVASAPVQENFRKQLFDMDRVNIDAIASVLESKQCTGRRYLDMLLRIENQPKNWNNPDTRERLQTIANKMIDEFYEFSTYEMFGKMLNEKMGVTAKDVDRQWVHDTFDNRLLLIDEAHNIRQSKEDVGIKEVTRGLEKLVKIADSLTLVLLTATPMFHTYEEVVFFMNLFLWNDRKQGITKTLKPSDFFNADATLKGGEAGERFRQWCQDYVSYVKGDNPFTFPFRLPPPKMIENDSLTKDFLGRSIGDNERLRYLSLVESKADGLQRDILLKTEKTDTEERRGQLIQNTVSVFPGNKRFRDVFQELPGPQYRYVGTPFLTPSELPKYAAKLATVIKTIEESKGVVLVYSNYVERGARLFAMALEEHGYKPAMGRTMLETSSYEGTQKGKYVLLTSDFTDAELGKMVAMSKKPDNRNGSQIRVIVTSRVVSEGVDFRFVRQIHILDPWWNMSRTEQVIGRGLRTCSHQLLPFDEQNCTVYLHVVRTGEERECFDEYTYRTKVEPKAMQIARVRKVMAESAMDCPLQNQINTLPEGWRNLEVSQRRSEGNQLVTYRLEGMLGPMFDDAPNVSECIVKPSTPDPEHVRPLSTYLDVRDELLTKLAKLLIDKPIWDRDDLLVSLRPYTPEVVIYNLQQAISSGFRFKDAFGRASVLESKGDLYALSPLGVPNGTFIERTTEPPARGVVSFAVEEEEPQEEALPEVAPDLLSIKREAYAWPADAKTRFSEEVLNGFIFDHEFTDTERRAYLKTRPTTLPFADRLMVPDSDLIVLGEGVFDPPGIPLGEEGSKFRAWNAEVLSRFVENKGMIFASLKLKDKKFVISKTKQNADGTFRRDIDKTQKKFEPIVCGTGEYDKTSVMALSKYIDKEGIGTPESQVIDGKTKKLTREDICVYTELLVREEHNSMWITPEELSVLYENPDNKKSFTVSFKK